jgi:hypothetical protein
MLLSQFLQEKREKLTVPHQYENCCISLSRVKMLVFIIPLKSSKYQSLGNLHVKYLKEH